MSNSTQLKAKHGVNVNNPRKHNKTSLLELLNTLRKRLR